MSSAQPPPEYPLPKYEYDPPPGCLVVLTIISIAAGAGWLVGRWTDTPALAPLVLFLLVPLGLFIAQGARLLGGISGCGCLVVLFLTNAVGVLVFAMLRRPPTL